MKVLKNTVKFSIRLPDMDGIPIVTTVTIEKSVLFLYLIHNRVHFGIPYRRIHESFALHEGSLSSLGLSNKYYARLRKVYNRISVLLMDYINDEVRKLSIDELVLFFTKRTKRSRYDSLSIYITSCFLSDTFSGTLYRKYNVLSDLFMIFEGV